MILKVHGLTQTYGPRKLFRGLNFQMPAGEFLSVLGPSGCGKSTLLRLIAGLEKPSEGEIQELVEAENSALVFQEPRLLPWLTVKENIELPRKLTAQPAQGSVADLLESLQLKPAIEKNFPHELSGGMKMRVALARALWTRPNLLLMDEPFSALDEQTRAKLQNELLRLKLAQPDLSFLFISHTINEAVYLSNRIMILNYHGELVHEWRRPADLGFDPSVRDQVRYFEESRTVSKLFAEKIGHGPRGEALT